MFKPNLIAFGMAIASPLALTPMPTQAQETSAQTGEQIHQRAQDAVSALRQEIPFEQVFAASFLRAVPEAQLRALAHQLSDQFGALTGVESVTPTGPKGAANISLRFEKALGKGTMQLSPDAPFKITGLLLNDFEPLQSDIPSILKDLRGLSGDASIYFTKLDGSAPLLAHNDTKPFAIGSTFKLYVLSALVRSIAAGEHRWDEVVRLNQTSFSSGQLHNWPQGTPLTLQSLATLMISISDNTATDQLIDVLGRDAVEAELIASGHSNPALTLPFMTTRELFVLKANGGPDLLSYASASAAQRREILRNIGDKDTSTNQIQSVFSGGPVAIDVEWLASAQDVAAIFKRIADAATQSGDETALGLMGVNTSINGSTREKWDYIGYKGGSEPGVLNLSWLLRDDAGAYYAMVMSWNDPDNAFDKTPLELLSGRAHAAMAALVD